MKRIFWVLSLLLLVACKSEEFIPTAPDYEDPTCWYTEWNDSTSLGADVFYVVSTWEEDWKTEKGKTSHYADVWNPTHREHMATEISRIAAYMGPDNNFYAPYYRHLTINSWVTRDEDLVNRRIGLAMEDVKTAFDNFQDKRDKSRPFVLAGFSQGGRAVVELLKYMSDKDFEQLVAAYVMGYKVTPKDTLECKRFHPAQGEKDLGVTICYNTVKDVKYIVPIISAPCAMCINPVNWHTDATPAQLHDTVIVAVSPEHHVLVVEGYSGDEYPPYADFINVGDIHSCEPWLYQESLGKNIALRIQTWREGYSD